MEETRSGDTRQDDRLEAAWNDYGGDLLRFAATQVGPDQAEDVVSRVMVNLLRRQTALPADLRPYLFRSVANEAAKHWRSLNRRQRREDLVSSDRSLAHSSTPTTPDTRIREALADLSPQQRAVVHLYYWNEMSVAEVAAELDIGSGSVKQHLHRARRRLASGFKQNRFGTGSVQRSLGSQS